MAVGENAPASGDFAPELPSPPGELLRFITCGSVDDGKSTLIGRLLHDAGAIQDDQLAALRADSRRFGTQGGGLDFALLVDGLAAEREQGITIDVAYRFFATARRHFIVADTPGHEQYTRNMVSAASTAELAVILVDARKGVLAQTRRHSYLAHLLGIRHFVLAVNKMDLVGHDRDRFEAIVGEFRRFADGIGLAAFTPIPICGLAGENVMQLSPAMAWYDGPTLVAQLETVDTAAGAATRPFRLPVQGVARPDPEFRGFAGLVSQGTARPGDAVLVLPSRRDSTIARIVTMDGDLGVAEAGRSVTLCLADALDCSRGDVIAAAAEPPAIADQFEASLVWLGEEALLPGRPYWMKLATQTVTARVAAPRHRVGMDTLELLAASTLALNDVGVAVVSTDRPVVFEPYEVSRDLGGFILIDKASRATVAAGMIRAARRLVRDVHWQASDVTRAARARLAGHAPAVLWFTGLSGAGKTTIANLVERKLHALGRHTFLLDGDNVRNGLSRDLGFSDADRIENIRRVGEVARLMTDAGLVVITAFISPFEAERRMVRAMMAPGEFIEIHVDTPLAEAERRDVKGLYRKARAGHLKDFTGIDSPYERPEAPEIRLETARLSAEQSADLVVARLMETP